MKFLPLDVVRLKDHKTAMVITHAVDDLYLIAIDAETVGTVKESELKLVLRTAPILQNFEKIISTLKETVMND